MFLAYPHSYVLNADKLESATIRLVLPTGLLGIQTLTDQ